MLRRRLSILLFLISATQFVGVVRANTVFTLTTTADGTDGACTVDNCTLREAIIAANASPGEDTITLASATYTLTLGSTGEEAAAYGDLDITDSLNIIGTGIGSSVISAAYSGQSDRIFHVDPSGTGITVQFSELTIQNANVTSFDGGGIYNRGNLTLTNVEVLNNHSNLTGGGIYNRGSLTLNNSIIRNNLAHSEGGGILNDTTGILTITNSTISGNSAETSVAGGIRNKGILTLTNSTVSNNQAATTGGAIASQGTANLNNVTIVDNKGGSGSTNYVGGVYNLSGGVFNFQNTILADNYDDTRPEVQANCSGTLNSVDYNLIGQSNCILTGATSHNITTANALLYPLGNYGGSTPTNIPRVFSPAIDNGNNATCTASDQRGQIRPADGNSNGTNNCDIGAVETLDIFPLVASAINTSAPSTDGKLVEGESLSVAVIQFTTTFDHPVYDPAGDSENNDVTNIANYLLVNAGTNSNLDTTSCQAGVRGDDSAIIINSIVYDSGTQTATININNGTPIVSGQYRLFVCANVQRITGIALDGNGDLTAGDDFVLNFSVDIPQAGTTFTVNSPVDSQDTLCGVTNCSLREAVIAANAAPGSTIVIPAGTYNLSLVGTNDDLALTGDLDILSNMTITGAGAANTILRGNGDSVFDVKNSAIVTFSDLTIENGTSSGLRIRNLANVTVSNSLIQNNLGRGISIQGSSASPPRPQITILNSTLTGNLGGLDAYQAKVIARNSTFTGNDAGGSYGGGINEAGGSLSLNDVTITNNHANEGGGVRTLGGGTVQNSIIYGNTADVYGNNCRGSLASAGNNLIGSDLPNLCSFQALASDLVDIDPLLGPLQDNGGPTPTRALAIGSPAVSGGNPSIPGSSGTACLTTDQRGITRIEAGCDMGAYQSQFAPYVTKVSSVTIPYTGQFFDGGVTDVNVTQLLVTVSEPLNDPVGDTDSSDVTNPTNYQLITDGSDDSFQTNICGVSQGDDDVIVINNVSFNKSTRLITLNTNGGTPLPVDGYRLLVCHPLQDLDGHPLDGNRDLSSGDDFVRSFSVIAAQPGPTYTVTTTADEVDGVCGILHCSLREAVIAANAAAGANTIVLPTGTYALTRSGANEDASATGDLDITGALTIQGQGPSSTIDAKNLDRALQIMGAYAITIQQISIVNGNAGTANGGAILNNAGGILTIVDSQINSNKAANGGAIYNGVNGNLSISNSGLYGNVATTYYGGAVFNSAILNIDATVFSGNNAGEGGGLMNQGAAAVATITRSSFAHHIAVSNGGAIENNLGATLTIRNSTISSNTASRGGGIYHFSGTTNLNNVTISANHADNDGGGIYRNGNTVNISNTLLAENIDASMSSASPDCWGTLASQDYNLIGNTAGCVFTGTVTHNVTGQASLLSTLHTTSTNLTEIHSILPGSPAIGAGNPAANGSGSYACEITDQWGVVRDDGPCDIGAFEEKLPITVYKVNSVPDTGDAQLVQDEIAGVPITQILVKFSKPAQDLAGNSDPHDVTNPANFQLVTKGNDTAFQTSVCGPAQGDDESILVNSVTYDNTSRTATLNLNGGVGLSTQAYRLLVCGSTSIKDLRGDSLDGNKDGIPGDDFLLDFTVKPIQRGPNFQVTTMLDVNDGYCSYDHCSLREAVIAANTRPNSTVNVPAGTYHITLGGTGENSAIGGDFDTTVNMTITGAGWNSTIIDGSSIDRVFHIVAGNLTLSNVTVQGGKPEQYLDGGGILNNGTLSLIDSHVQGNQTDKGSGGAIGNTGTMTITNVVINDNTAVDGAGGGIENNGTLNVIDSTIRNNTATNGVVGGGGIHNENGSATLTRVTLNDNAAVSGGGIENRLDGSTITITNSTISGNAAVYDGGGISVSFDAAVTLNNTTITNNIADSDHDGVGQGGGLYNGGFGSTVTLQNTLISGNIDQGGEAPDCGGEALTSEDYNLIGTLSGCSVNGTTTHNLSEIDPQLGPLLSNGGPTQTQALLVGSPAINAGNNSKCESIDQRGVARPQQSLCDIGAYEYVTGSPVILSTVVDVGSFEDSNNGHLDEGEITNANITQLWVGFSKPMFDPGGNTQPSDVTNPLNYQLIQVGTDGIPQTNVCGVPQGDDQNIDINSVTYSPGNYRATLMIHSGLALAPNGYRLLACGTLKDATGYMLDGNKDGIGGDPFLRNFSVSPAINGQILEVNVTNDTYDGICNAANCSLRDAFAAANSAPGSAIHLPPGTYNLSIAGQGENAALSGDLDILANMTIYGDDAATTIVNANGIDRVFDVPGIVNGDYLVRSITIRGLTIKGGNAETGGGLYNDSAQSTIIIRDSVITNNTATGNVQSYFRSSGGGIANTGTMTIINSIIQNNSSVGSVGGGIANQQGNLTIQNSTIRNNSAGGVSGDRSTITGGYGTLIIRQSTINNNTNGGINIDKNQATITNTTVSNNDSYGIAVGNNAAGWLKLNNVTIVGNSGVGLLKAASFADITMTNTLIYNNSSADCDANSSFSALTLVEQDYNLVGTIGSRCELSGSHNLIGANPLIGPLQNNGGLSQTHALLAGSPAEDAGNAATCEANDQRGNPRPEGNACDIGSYENRPDYVDLHLTFVGPSDPVRIHTDTTYTFTINNGGSIAANHVALTVALPDGTTPISNSVSQGVCNTVANNVTCDLDTIGSNHTASVNLTVRYAFVGNLVPVANVTSEGIEQNPANNTATIITQVVANDADNASPSTNYAASSTVMLSWIPVSWAQGYEVEIAIDTGFANPVYASGLLSAETLFIQRSLSNGVYYWRVRAISNSKPGLWSQPVKFTVQVPGS
ncbi:MAG: choice-of-anchor Q domain-containing protein [Chloroflexota bacterium]